MHLLGTLPPAEEATLIRHLDTCESCQSTLEHLASEPDWLKRTAEQIGTEVEFPSSSLSGVLARLKTIEGSTPTNAVLEEVNDLSFLLPSQQPGHLGRLMHYEITAVLGRGGMGTVLKARDEKLGRTVAIKVLASQMASRPDSHQRFAREARAAAAVHHDNVVTIFAVEEAQGVPFIVMELISGVSLQERLNLKPPLELAQILRIGMQTASGLAAAHAQGLIHRDVKPANILLENGVERVKLTDFGLASTADDSGLSREGIVAGTPELMSPEQARGEPIDHRADLFCLGSVLYALCTGQSPFCASSPLATLKRASEETPIPIGNINPFVPDWLVTIIEKLLAKDPRARFQTAAEVADLLGKHLIACREAERAGAFDQASLLGHRSVPGRRRRWVPLVLGAILLGAATLGAWLIFHNNPNQPVVVNPANQPASSAEQAAVRTGPASSAIINSSTQPPISPATAPEPAPVPRVLVVIASRDFWYSDLSVVWSELQNGGAKAIIASTSSQAIPVAGQPGKAVTPDIFLFDVQAKDFDALIFCGGKGISEYLGDTPAAGIASQLVHEMLANEGFVGAVSHGPAVLAEAGVLNGKQATCIKYENRYFVELLEKAGAVWNDEPVVKSGHIICGRGTSDAKAFTQAFLQSLKNRESK